MPRRGLGRCVLSDRSGLLTLAAYSTAAMLIALVALLGIFRFGAVERVSSLEPLPIAPSPQPAAADAHTVRRPAEVPGGPSRAEQRVQMLEAMLAEKSDLLRRQAQQISRQSGDLADLRRQYENAMFIIEGLQPSGAEPSGNTAGSNDAGVEPTDQTPSEPLSPEQVHDLQAELVLAHAVHDALVEDLDALQAELEQAYVRIGQLRVEGDVKSTNDLRDALALEAAAANIVVRLGQDAVTPLIEYLQHDNPVVRRWAATVLGSLGTQATDAVSGLTACLRDPNVDVQRRGPRSAGCHRPLSCCHIGCPNRPLPARFFFEIFPPPLPRTLSPEAMGRRTRDSHPRATCPSTFGGSGSSQ